MTQRARSRLRSALVWVAALLFSAVVVEFALRTVFERRFANRFYCCGDDPEPLLCELGMAYRGGFVEFPDAEGGIWRYDPLLGHRLRPNLRGRMYKGGRVSSNAAGARGTTEYPVAHDGRPRILAIGDSFTFGQEVDDHEAWTARLEQLDPQREVINLGGSAYGYDQALLSMREGLAYRPDVVLLGYVWVDRFRNPYEFHCSPKPYFRRVENRYRLANVPVPVAPQMAAQLRRRPLSLMLGQVLWRQYFGTPTRPSSAQEDALSGYLLDEIVRRTREAGARPLFVRLPTDFEVRDRSADPFFNAFCASRGIECLDLLPVMASADDRSGHEFQRVYIRQQHYSPAGNQLVAEAVDAWLRAHPIQPRR